MAWFTDSPIEKMMNRKPDVGQRPVVSASLPKTSPCYGCPYGQGHPCVGVCLKNLMEKPATGRKEHA